MTAVILRLLCLVWGSFELLVNSLLRAANVPVHLNLQRAPPNTNLSQVLRNPKLLQNGANSRTKEYLFQNILGIQPGEDFEFHLPKWRMLQRCGLFYYNLSAKAEVVNDRVVLNVTGIELPSLTFAPELSLAPSLQDSQFSGGVS
jgi:hypothetical protein